MTNATPDLNSKEVLDLVEAAKAGDAKAFSQLVVLLTPVVRAQTKRIFVNGKLEGDDLFQEGMFGVMEAVRKFDASRGASFLTYANLCIRSKLLSATGGTQDENVPDSDVENVSSDNEQFAYFELLDFISERLTQREFITLKLFLSGYSYTQIADKLETTPKAVDGTLQRARKKLKEYFQ